MCLFASERVCDREMRSMFLNKEGLCELGLLRKVLSVVNKTRKVQQYTDAVL